MEQREVRRCLRAVCPATPGVYGMVDRAGQLIYVAPGAVGLVVQHRNRKIVLTGDFLHVPNEDDPLLLAPDVCSMDANTWHPADWTGHSSVLGNLRLIDKWKPRRVYFVHYSGYEDRERAGEPIHGPLTHGQFRDELHRVRPDLDLRLAEHGMNLGDSADWPD